MKHAVLLGLSFLGTMTKTREFVPEAESLRARFAKVH
jgi:hypothetical protein